MFIRHGICILTLYTIATTAPAEVKIRIETETVRVLRHHQLGNNRAVELEDFEHGRSDHGRNRKLGCPGRLHPRYRGCTSRCRRFA